MRESLRTGRRASKIGLENLVCRTRPGYRAYLRLKHGASTPKERPIAPWQNTTLKSRPDVEQALALVRKLGLVDHADLPKNWDALAALAVVLDHTDPSSAVMDAGAEYYSSLLPSLFLYGYQNLVGINREFLTESEIRSALELSGRYGFELTGPVDLIAQEKAVRWEGVDLEFTYVTFCLRKTNVGDVSEGTYSLDAQMVYRPTQFSSYVDEEISSNCSEN